MCDADARLSERERIARELHDTLLQTFQGLVLQFQSVTTRIGKEQPLRPALDRALDQAEAALVEGRRSVRHLRASDIDRDLADVLSDFAEMQDRGPDFHLTIEGTPRRLVREIRQEIERIAVEAMRNAYRHSGGTRIEASIGYHAREFRLGVRDDGTGLPPEVSRSGDRKGHYGLVGMRERATRIGGTLTITSGPGTTLMLVVPAKRAYATGQRHGRWLAALTGDREPLVPVRDEQQVRPAGPSGDGTDPRIPFGSASREARSDSVV